MQYWYTRHYGYRDAQCLLQLQSRQQGVLVGHRQAVLFLAALADAWRRTNAYIAQQWQQTAHHHASANADRSMHEAGGSSLVDTVDFDEVLQLSLWVDLDALRV